MNIDIGIAFYGCFKLDFCCGLSFFVGNHSIDDVSTQLFFHRKEYSYCSPENNDRDIVNKKRCIGYDVWIGSSTLLLPKVHNIGNGAIVGAGSVVTHDVEPYSIVVGNPVKVINTDFLKKILKS